MESLVWLASALTALRRILILTGSTAWICRTFQELATHKSIVDIAHVKLATHRSSLGKRPDVKSTVA